MQFVHDIAFTLLNGFFLLGVSFKLVWHACHAALVHIARSAAYCATQRSSQPAPAAPGAHWGPLLRAPSVPPLPTGTPWASVGPAAEPAPAAACAVSCADGSIRVCGSMHGSAAVTPAVRVVALLSEPCGGRPGRRAVPRGYKRQRGPRRRRNLQLDQAAAHASVPL